MTENRKSNLIDVVCAIILKGEKVLVAQRSEEMKHPLKWEFPGGKIEQGESDLQSLKREIQEELNVEIEILEKLKPTKYIYENISINLIPFIAQIVSGELKNTEHKILQWINKEQLPDIDWVEADIQVVNEFLKTNDDSRRII